jgi:phosphate transport system permease protein
VTDQGEGTAAEARGAGSLALLEPRWTWAPGETIVRVALFLAAAFAVFVTLAILMSLVFDTVIFFGHVGPWEFYSGTIWDPQITGSFGVLPLVLGTFIVAGGAAAIGLPLGLASAIYLREYAPERVREVVKPVLEILAGVPTIVFAFFAIFTISPVLRGLFDAEFLNGANAIIVIGILIIPLVSSLSEDALTAVPVDLRDGALALGATRHEAVSRVTVPSALSGIAASFLLAFSRAVGETMVVLLVAGQSTVIQLNIFRQMSTMAGFIAQAATGDLAPESLSYQSLFAVGFTLFVFTFLLNVFSSRLRARFREAYE